MRRKRALIAAVLGSLLALTAQTPAFAGKGVTASFDSGVGCDAGQNATSVQVILTDVPQGQRISIRTDAYDLVRGHASYSGGVAKYDVELGGRLNRSQPATTWITDNAWSGSFRVTGLTCRDAAPASLSAQQATNCPDTAQIAVAVANPNSVRTVYEVGGDLPTRTVTLLGGESTTLTYAAERGEYYRISASGNDGTRGSTRISVPNCATPEQPGTGVVTTPATTSPGTPGMPTVPGGTVTTTVPGVPPAATTPTLASSAPSPSGSTSSSASPTTPGSSGSSSTEAAVTLATDNEPEADPTPTEASVLEQTYEVVSTGTAAAASNWWFLPTTFMFLGLMAYGFVRSMKRPKRQ